MRKTCAGFYGCVAWIADDFVSAEYAIHKKRCPKKQLSDSRMYSDHRKKFSALVGLVGP